MVKIKNVLVQGGVKLAPTGIDKKVGETLARIRCDLSLTQRQVGEASKLGQRQISRIECAARSISIRDVVAYCRAVDYEIKFVPRKKETK